MNHAIRSLAAAVAIAAAGAGMNASAAPAPEFAGIDNWINSAPLSMQQLRGKVVICHGTHREGLPLRSGVACLRVRPRFLAGAGNARRSEPCAAAKQAGASWLRPLPPVRRGAELGSLDDKARSR